MARLCRFDAGALFHYLEKENIKMAEPKGAEPTTPSTLEPLPVEPKAEPVTPAEPESEKDAEFWKGKATAMEKDAKKAAKRLAELEEVEQKRTEAEMSELDKLKKQLADAQKQYAEAERKSLRQKVAVETGLPAILADRLQGDDEDAMREDAAKLLEALKQPEPVKKPAPTINPTNPGATTSGESDAARRERLGLPPRKS